MYFSAIQKIGEQALQSSTSQILGEGLPLPLYPLYPLSPTSTPGLLLLSPAPGCSVCPPAPPLRPRNLPCLPFLGPRGVSFRVLLFQEVPQRHSPCSLGPRVQTLLEPKPLPTTPCRAVTGLGQVLPESRALCEIPGLWSQNPASGREEGGWGRLPPPKLFFVPPGEILVQMSDTQRHLNSDLEVVVSIGLGWGATQESGMHSPRSLLRVRIS